MSVMCAAGSTIRKKGDPDSGIAPGTAFEDIPDDWECPECGVGKDDFSAVEG